MTWWILPSNPPTGGLRDKIRKIDFLGLITSAAGLILLLIPISGGGSYFEWNSPMVRRCRFDKIARANIFD